MHISTFLFVFILHFGYILAIWKNEFRLWLLYLLMLVLFSGRLSSWLFFSLLLMLLLLHFFSSLFVHLWFGFCWSFLLLSSFSLFLLLPLLHLIDMFTSIFRHMLEELIFQVNQKLSLLSSLLISSCIIFPLRLFLSILILSLQ
jgi:hypothetical protein